MFVFIKGIDFFQIKKSFPYEVVKITFQLSRTTFILGYQTENSLFKDFLNLPRYMYANMPSHLFCNGFKVMEKIPICHNFFFRYQVSYFKGVLILFCRKEQETTLSLMMLLPSSTSLITSLSWCLW